MAVLTAFYSRAGENYFAGEYRRISVGNTEKAAKLLAELIGDYAWIGAGATVLPGVRVGRHAVVGAASVITKDVPDYAVAVGNPAKVIKMLDKEKFQENEA